MNKRTSLAQKEDVIKRTVYVKDIDQQVKKKGNLLVLTFRHWDGSTQYKLLCHEESI